MTSGEGRPADDSRPVWTVPSGLAVVRGRHRRDHHRGLGLAEQLRHRADAVEGLGQPGRRHRGRAVPEALQGREVRAIERVVAEHHVDQRRRQERVGDAVAFDQLQEPADVGLGHDHDFAAAGEDREAEHAGRVGERGQGQVDRAAVEGVAHQRDRRHRLEVAAGEHDALGAAGGAAGADQGDDVVGLRGFDAGIVAGGVEPVREAGREVVAVAEADQGGQLGEFRRDPADEVLEAGLEDQRGAVEQVQELGVLAGGVARVDRAPHGTRAGDAEDAGERGRVVGREDADLVPGPHAGVAQRAGDGLREIDHLAVGDGAPVEGQAGRVRVQGGAFFQVEVQRHRRPSRAPSAAGPDLGGRLDECQDFLGRLVRKRLDGIFGR